MRPPSRVSQDGRAVSYRSIRAAPSTRAAPSVVPTNGRSFTTVQPRAWINDLSHMPRKFLRQILGLNPFRTSYWSLYRPINDLSSRSILATGIISAIAAGVPLPIIGVIFSHIIDEFPPPENELTTSIGELLGVAVAYFVVTWTWSVCWGITGEKVSRGLREAMVERVVGMDMTFFDIEDPDMTAILTGDTQMIQMGTSEKVGLFIQSISYFVAAFVVGFILNATLTGILLAAIIPTMVIVVMTGTTAVSRLSKRASEFTEKAADVASSAIEAVAVVQAFGANSVLSDDHYRVLSQATRAGFKKSLAGAIMLGCVYFSAYSANALAFFEGSRLTNGGGAGTIYAVVFLILDASFVVGQFGPFIQIFAQAAAAGSKVLSLIDHVPADIDPYSQNGLASDHSTLEQDLVVDNVSFWYPSRSTTRVLDQVSLRFRSGTTTGIVGMSGSGKSTIASLLLRLYDPTKGRILLGDTDIRDYNVAQLRSQIALVDQDPVLFTGTILDNIRHGIANADKMSEEEIYQRCCRAAADANADFISGLAHGIRTKVGGQGGTRLSGGQRQRICLARALARRPAMLVLDEPTSALDTVSESLILQALSRVSASGCTVIMIAHRLATIKDADNIIVMGHGEFLEEGTHDELLEQQGAYSALVEAQGFGRTGSTDASTHVQSSASSESSLTKFDMKGASEQPEEAQAEEEQVQAQHSPGYLIKRCVSLSGPETPLIALGIAASMISGAIIIGEAIVFGHLVSLINTPTTDTAQLQSRVDFFCLMFFIISLVALFAYTISGTCFGLVSESLILRVRDISLRNILRQDLAWFSLPGHSPHELMASINMDVGHLSGLSGVIIGTVFSVCTSIIGGIILAHIIAWRIAVVLLSAVPVMILAGFLRLRILAKFEERHETAYNAAAALASEACSSIRTVAAFGREADVLSQYRRAIEKPYKQSFKFNVAGNLMLAISLAITYFVYALAYWWGSVNVREGRYTEQDFFIVLPALLFSAQSSGQMFSLAPEVTRARSAANSVFRLHDEQPTIMRDDNVQRRGGRFGKLRPEAEEKAGCHEKHGIQGQDRGSVELENVTLVYPSRPNDPVFEKLDMRIEPGQFIGVVGPSGAGKSSLVSLLERYYDPSVGSVRVDGQDIRKSSVIEYRQRLALVSQEPDLFSGSIAFNIALGRRRDQVVELHDIEEVCRQIGLHDFVIGLPEGYQTECGTNGSKLSGGQRQRVAVARAMIRDPEILLLDEATASLDSHTEAQVQAAMMAASRDRTTIVVAHRLSTVQRADRIFVFDEGRIVESGTHDELLTNKRIYAGMVQAQNLA